jgi:Fe-S cluster biogenesis protein NfuA
MIRSTLKRGIKKIFGMEAETRPPAPPPPIWKTDAPEPVKVDAPTKAEAPIKAEPMQAAPVQAAPVKAAEPIKAVEAEPVKAVEPVQAAPMQAAPVQAEPVSAPVQATPEPVAQAAKSPELAMEPMDDTAGKFLTMEAVQELMDEMVRPALQGDGGDITLLKVENNDIYVKLVGSCSTCPSSIMTMKMGVEALLKEEFPMMGSLIQVD